MTLDLKSCIKTRQFKVGDLRNAKSFFWKNDLIIGFVGYFFDGLRTAGGKYEFKFGDDDERQLRQFQCKQR